MSKLKQKNPNIAQKITKSCACPLNSEKIRVAMIMEHTIFLYEWLHSLASTGKLFLQFKLGNRNGEIFTIEKVLNFQHNL